jgi:hypothetical protein
MGRGVITFARRRPPDVTRALNAVLLAAALVVGCARPRARAPDEHARLGAAFVGGDSAGLRHLLHPDLIVQPPAPDSARRGADAIEYLVGLAMGSRVSASRLRPTDVIREGPFLLEEGTWYMASENRMLRSRYVVRWRPAGENAWRVVLLRWSRFR